MNKVIIPLAVIAGVGALAYAIGGNREQEEPSGTMWNPQKEIEGSWHVRKDGGVYYGYYVPGGEFTLAVLEEDGQTPKAFATPIQASVAARSKLGALGFVMIEEAE